MTTGQEIAAARKRLGMTQDRLAEALGVTRQAVAKWESGKSMPGTANLFELSRVLGIDLVQYAAPQPEASGRPAQPGPDAAAGPGKAPSRRPFWGLWVIYTALVCLLAAAVSPVLSVLATVLALGAAFLTAAVLWVKGKNGGRLLSAVLALLLSLGLAGGAYLAAFAIRSCQRAEAIWGLAVDELPSDSAVRLWVEQYDEPGIYYCTFGSAVDWDGTAAAGQRTIGQATEQVILVYRSGVTAAGSGQVRRDPLHYRFGVRYDAAADGEAVQELDVLRLTSRNDFGIDFAINGSEADAADVSGDAAAIGSPAIQELVDDFRGRIQRAG